MAIQYAHIKATEQVPQMKKFLKTTEKNLARHCKTSIPTEKVYKASRGLYNVQSDTDPKLKKGIESQTAKLLDFLKENPQTSFMFKKGKNSVYKGKDPELQQLGFITSSPNCLVRTAAMHRDWIESGAYTVFFLLTRMTKENGSVTIYPGSQYWSRNYQHRGSDLELKIQRKKGPMQEPITLTGEVGDIFLFDGRLMHRSVRNVTKDETRASFSFIMYK